MQRVEADQRFFLLCLGSAGVGASVGLFVAAAWGWGVAALLVGVIAFGALRGVVRKRRSLMPERSAPPAWRTRIATRFATWRTRSQLEAVEAARGPALQDLGAAVREGDRRAAAKASQYLDELDELEQNLKAELTPPAPNPDEMGSD